MVTAEYVDGTEPDAWAVLLTDYTGFVDTATGDEVDEDAVRSCCAFLLRGCRRAQRWPGGARPADEQPDVTVDVPIAACRGNDEGLATFDVDGLAVHRRQCAGAGQHRGDGEPWADTWTPGVSDSMRKKGAASSGSTATGPAAWAPVCSVSAATSVSAVVSTTDSATSRVRPRKTSSSDAVVLVRSNRID